MLPNESNSMKSYFLQNVSIFNYRSIGDAGIELTDLNKINIIIGANKSGKSTILRFLARHLNAFGGGPRAPVEDIDRPYQSDGINPTVGIAVSPLHPAWSNHFQQASNAGSSRALAEDYLFRVNGYMKIFYEILPDGQIHMSDATLMKTAEDLGLTDRQWTQLMQI